MKIKTATQARAISKLNKKDNKKISIEKKNNNNEIYLETETYIKIINKNIENMLETNSEADLIQTEINLFHSWYSKEILLEIKKSIKKHFRKLGYACYITSYYHDDDDIFTSKSIEHDKSFKVYITWAKGSNIIIVRNIYELIMKIGGQ